MSGPGVTVEAWSSSICRPRPRPVRLASKPEVGKTSGFRTTDDGVTMVRRSPPDTTSGRMKTGTGNPVSGCGRIPMGFKPMPPRPVAEQKPKIWKKFFDKVEYKLSSRCSSEVEVRAPYGQSGGHGFKSCWVLGCFLLPFSSNFLADWVKIVFRTLLVWRISFW